MTFLKFTDRNGNPVAINLRHVVYFEPVNLDEHPIIGEKPKIGTFIATRLERKAIVVQETFEEVTKIMESI